MSPIVSNFYTSIEVTIEVPHTIQILQASDNLLREVRFRGNKDPTELIRFYVKDNRIRRFDFNPPTSLEEIDMRNNVGLEYMCPPLKQLWQSIDEGAIEN